MIRASSFDSSLTVRNKVPDVDVGLVYTYERQWMPRLLSSLAAAGRGVAMRLILVDNDSADGVEAWKGYVPDTVVLRNRRRYLYPANLNHVLRASTARYVLLLNTDMFFDVSEPCLLRMVRFMDSRPQCGIASCGLYHEDGQFAYPARRFQNLAVVLARRCGLGRFMRRTLDRYLYRDHAPDATWETEWLSGAFLMLRRDAMTEVGLFDEGFGKYFEDVDMCLRMARAGWNVMYHGGTYCYHLERRASRRIISTDALRHLRAYVRWHWKWGFSVRPAGHEPLPKRRAA
jgi:N-acetylglucosaminyl-diphospho-decaprenol L-rhamnosyltransferase